MDLSQVRRVLGKLGLSVLAFCFVRLLIHLGVPLDSWMGNAASWALGARQMISADALMWITVGFLGAILAAAEWWLEPVERLYRRFRPPKVVEPKMYLPDRDTELSSAVYLMVLQSAWGIWYRSQFPDVASGSVHEMGFMQTAAHEVTQAAINGKLEIRGRPKGGTEYESISSAVWRLGALGVEKSKFTIWKVIPIARSNVDAERIRKFLDYDSLIVDSQQFQTIWPGRAADSR
jgi:hypothetical protein